MRWLFLISHLSAPDSSLVGIIPVLVSNNLPIDFISKHQFRLIIPFTPPQTSKSLFPFVGRPTDSDIVTDFPTNKHILPTTLGTEGQA